MPTPTLLVANRGEIACRIIRAAKTLNLRTVAVYSEADQDSPHVAMADTAVNIGPARASESYLQGERLLAAAMETGATLLHPGYGFLSENAGFAAQCRDQGLCFVGPTPEVITLMGDKEQARQAAARAGVPVLPGSAKLMVNDQESIIAAGMATGFPLLVKASAGGGGIGMRLVTAPDELLAAVATTSGMAQKSFGDGSVYLERAVQRARHVEIQVFGFGDGTAIHLFERDCSLQRRHQKVIEEGPALDIPVATRQQMATAAVQLAESSAYAGAGTVEFLYDTVAGEYFFLEMNTRIQVEHPVTEMITGIDLVAAQLRLAMGEKLSNELSQARIQASGHAIEARIYAENPARNFLPSPGPLNIFRTIDINGVRYEAGYQEGGRVTPFYDPMIMKVIAHGATRDEAIARLDLALSSTRIEGIATNVNYLRSILASSDFTKGNVHTNFLAQNHADLLQQMPSAAMEHVIVRDEIGASADTVWPWLRDFEKVGAWARGTQVLGMKGCGVGAERIVQSSVGRFTERCETCDDSRYSLTYSIVDSPWAIRSYLACVQLSATPSGRCAIHWECSYEPSESLAPGFRDDIARMYAHFIAGLRQLSQPPGPKAASE